MWNRVAWLTHQAHDLKIAGSNPASTILFWMNDRAWLKVSVLKTELLKLIA